MNSFWGQGCGKVKIVGNQIQQVLTNSGTPSKLYKDILEHLKELPKEDMEALRDMYRPWEGKYIRSVDNNRDLALALYSRTHSPNFKEWFKGSKAVDENGEPKLLFHGSVTPNISEFKAKFPAKNAKELGTKAGLFFTDHLPYAKEIKNNTEIYPVFLNMQHPDLENREEIDHITAEQSSERGYDGVIGTDYGQTEGKTYVVYDANQIKSLFNEGRYGKSNPNQFQQKAENTKTTSSKASPETQARYTEWAQRAGFDLKEITKGLTDSEGNKLDRNGAIDFLKKTILIAKGKEDVATGEEVSHGIVRMVKETNPSLFKKMMNEVGKYDLYSEVMNQYGKDPDYMIDSKPNIPKIKEETLGKILNELVINKLEGTTEKPELLSKASSWMDSIKEFIKNLLTKIGFDPTIDPLEKVAKDFTEGKLNKENPVKDLTDKKEEENYQDVKNRIDNTINNLFSTLPNKTAIITHGTVLNILKTNSEEGFYKLQNDKQGSKNGEIVTKEKDGKTLYFVRHGESQANISKEKNTIETPLTESGKEQAKKVSNELKELGVTNVISTDTKRTKDTASIIREELGMKDDSFKQINEEKEKQLTLFDKLSQPAPIDKKEDKEGNSHYEDTTGKKVARVTDTVKKFLSELFKDKSQKGDLNTALNEFKKQYGTARHADMENMHERHIDASTGELREQPLPLNFDDAYFANHSEDDRTYYKTLENYLYGYTDDAQIKHEGLVTNKVDFPEGTKFMWEKTVFDPTAKIYNGNGEKPTIGLGGTIDFMAITPSGKVSLFDWKFVGGLVKNEGIRDYMKKAYDKQMQGYVHILTSPSYGVKQEDIEKVRMIPVAVKYNEEAGHEGEILALNIGTTDYKSEKTPYLLPYVTSSEQISDKPIQTLVKALTHTLNLTIAKGSSEKDVLVRKNRIANLERSILHLQLSNDFTPFIEQVSAFNKDTLTNLKKIREDYNTFDFKSVKNLKDLDDKLEPLIEIIKSLQLYKTLGDFKDYIDNSTEEGKELREKLDSVARNAKYLFEGDKNKDGAEDLLNRYVKAWADSRSIWDILSPQPILDYLDKEFRTPSKSPSITIRAAYDLNNIRLHKVEQESNKMIDTLKPIWEAITKDWGGVKKLSDIVEAKDKNGKGTNKLIDEFSDETFSLLKKNVEDKKHEDVRKLLDESKFNAWATPYKEKQLQQINESSWVAAYGKSAEERKQEAIDKVISETSWYSEYAMSNANRLRNFLKDDLRSKEYKEMLKPENKPALDFYNFTMDVNKQAVAAGLFHQSHMSTFLPWIEKSLADKVAFGGRWNVWDQFRRAFTSVKGGDAPEQIDPLTNKVISKIPKYFTKEISRVDKNGEKDFSNVADDLIKNVGLFAQSVIDYQSKIDMENTFDALKIVEETKGMLLTDTKGNIVGKTAENKNIQHLVDYLETHINDQSILNKLDFKGGSVTIDNEEREYDTRKTLESLKAYFSYNVLGFNTVTSIFRSLTTGTTGFYNAGRYYTNKEFMKAYSDFINFRTFKSDVKLTTALMKAFLPVEENLQETLDQFAANKISEADFQAFSMKMVKSAHNIVQYANYMAHLDNAIIINGKIVNAREYLNKNSSKYNLDESKRREFEKNLDNEVKKLVEEKGLIKNAKVDDKGKLSIDGIDMNDFTVADFKSLVRVQGRVLSGNISETDQSHIRSNALARQMFLFTNWLPQSIDQRFGGLSYNQGIQSYEYGRMRMVAKILITNEGGLLQKIGTLADMYKANDKGVKALHKMYEQHKADYLKKTGLELHMSPDEFYDMVRQNMKIQGKEILSLLTFLSLSLGLSAVLPKKDDSQWQSAQGYFAYIRRIVNRGKDELEMFFNPLKFAEFGSGAKLPVLGVFGELTTALSHLAKFGYGVAIDEDNTKKHYIPQIIHTIPNGKAIYDIGSVIFPEWYKENTGTVLNPEPAGNVTR